jgi:hypothetical protein
VTRAAVSGVYDADPRSMALSINNATIGSIDLVCLAALTERRLSNAPGRMPRAPDGPDTGTTLRNGSSQALGCQPTRSTVQPEALGRLTVPSCMIRLHAGPRSG